MLTPIKLFLLTLCLLCAPIARAADAERYDGKISVMGQTLRFVLELSRTDPPRATIAIPEQGLLATAMSKLTLEKSKLIGTLPLEGAPVSVHPTFEIEFAADNQSATGTMIQGGQKFPVTLTRLATGEPAGPKRPQNPVGALPYAAREVLVASSDGAKLPGTLTIPNEESFGKGPHACALLITGSGVQDRDESIVGHKPFAVLSDRLTRAGIAVLRVDDRSFGGNLDPLKGEGTTETFVLDARACVDFLRTQSDIDPKRIGLIGHSEGGLIAPILAAQDPDKIAFVVMLAGPGVNGQEVLREQMIAVMRAEGMNADKFADVQKAQEIAFKAIVSNASQGELEQAVEAFVTAQAQVTGQKYEPAQLRQAVTMASKQLTTPWIKTFLALDPALALAQVKCPVLALNGALDAQVLAKQNIPPIAAALAKGNNPDVTIAVLPGLNHLFQPCKTGAVSEYEKIETTIDEGVLTMVIDWINKRTKASTN